MSTKAIKQAVTDAERELDAMWARNLTDEELLDFLLIAEGEVDYDYESMTDEELDLIMNQTTPDKVVHEIINRYKKEGGDNGPPREVETHR